MENEMDMKELEEMQRKLEAAEPIPLRIHMSQQSLDFIIKELRILDIAKYKLDHGIQITNKHSNLQKFHARLILSDGTNKIINLREKI